VRRIRAPLALLDGAFAADRNLGAGFCFHLLERVATGSDEQTNLRRESYVLVNWAKRQSSDRVRVQQG
jgi:hypothetical protein